MLPLTGGTVPRYALIDLGSNTIRLCIYEVSSSQKQNLTRKDITILLNYKIMAGLASFVKEGEISKKGIKKAINTINAHLKRASHFNCKEIHVFATAVIRNCANSEEAAKAISEACKIPLKVLSTWDEAHLGFCGASLDRPIEDGLLIDIGGGSTELTVVNKTKDSNSISIPQGSLSSYSSYVAGIIPTQSEIMSIQNGFKENLQASGFGLFKQKELYGIGGSIRSAAKVYGDVCNDGERDICLLPDQIDEIFWRYKTDPDTFLHKALQTIPDRIHTFIPGCVIIKELFDLTQAQKLTICKSGIREGYLVDRILN